MTQIITDTLRAKAMKVIAMARVRRGRFFRMFPYATEDDYTSLVDKHYYRKAMNNARK